MVFQKKLCVAINVSMDNGHWGGVNHNSLGTLLYLSKDFSCVTS